MEYEGGDRLNVPLYRLDQLERYRAAGDDGDRPPPRIHRLGGSTLAAGPGEDPAGHPADGGRAARPVRPPHGQRGGYAFPPDSRVAAGARVQLPLRGHARPAQGHRGGQARHGAAAARWTACWWATSATARPRSRSAPPSRRCRAASRSRCWCRPRFWRSSTAAPSPSGWPTSRCKIEVLSRFRTAKEQKAALAAAGRGTDRHRHRHPPPALQGRGFQGSRPAGGGRGAPLRREAQGAAQGAAALGGRADPHRHADPSHAAPLARRAPRPHPDRDRRRATARPSSPSSSRGTTRCWRRRSPGRSTAAGRCSWCTTGSRPSTPSPRGSAPLAPRARVGVAHGQMAGRGAGEGHAGLRGGRGGHPGLHHDRGVRARRAQRQHHGGARRPSLRAGAALPAPGPGGPEPPAGLLLPPGARHHRCATPRNGCGCWSIIPSWGRATGSRSRTWRSGARATCWAPSSRATPRRWDSICICAGWRRRSGPSGARATPEQPPQPPDVVLDRPAHLPDGYVPDDDVKLDLYRRLARAVASGEIDGLRDELRERFGPLPAEAETLLDMARLRVLGAALGLQHVLVRGDEARLTFRPGTPPRLAGLTSALDDVQLAADVRRTVPLSLRLMRLGGEPIVPALVRALHKASGRVGRALGPLLAGRESRPLTLTGVLMRRTAVDRPARRHRRHRRLLQLPRPLLGPRRRGRRGRRAGAHARSGWARSSGAGKGMRPNRRRPNSSPTSGSTTRCLPRRSPTASCPLDSASIAEAIWPELAELRGSHWHDTLMARRSSAPPTSRRQRLRRPRRPACSSTSSSGSAQRGAGGAQCRAEEGRERPRPDPRGRRLRRSSPPSSPRIRAAGRTAASCRPSPGAVRARRSTAPAGRWRRGQISGWWRRRSAIHIIKRPARRRCGPAQRYLAQQRRRPARLDLHGQPGHQGGHQGGEQRAGDDPRRHGRVRRRRANSTAPIATFKGGELTVQEFMRWVRALPPPYAAQLKSADDSMLTRFARILTQNVLLLRQADCREDQGHAGGVGRSAAALLRPSSTR